MLTLEECLETLHDMEGRDANIGEYLKILADGIEQLDHFSKHTFMYVVLAKAKRSGIRQAKLDMKRRLAEFVENN